MISRYTLQPPIISEIGDVMKCIGNRIEQWRNGILVTTSLLIEEQIVEELETVGGQRIDSIYLERTMPGQNVAMAQVRENQTTGVIIVDFSSGNQHEYTSWEAVGEIAANIDSTSDLAEKILLGKAYRASPDGTNKTTQVNASVSTNLLASIPIVYTAPE